MASQPNLQNNGWISVPWGHYIGRGSGSDGTDAALGHGPSGNQATFPILVNWADTGQAIADLCGTHSFDATTGYLNRNPAKQHPVPWLKHLYCSRVVSVKPMHWTGKDVLQVGNWSRYSYAMLSLLFQQPKFPVLTDSFLDSKFTPVSIGGTLYRQEYYRYMERTPNVASDIQQIDANSLIFAEGAGAPGPVAGTTKLTVPVGQPLTIGDFILIWRNVPYYGLFSPTTYRAENLLKAANKVNSVTFLGYPAGTLLFAGATFVPNETPYPPDVLEPGITTLTAGVGDTQQNMLWPALTVDVTLLFKFKDPPNGSTTRGWNCQPFRGDMKWYLATTDGAAGSPASLLTYDFRQMFAYST